MMCPEDNTKITMCICKKLPLEKRDYVNKETAEWVIYCKCICGATCIECQKEELEYWP